MPHHGRNGEVTSVHLLGQPVHLPPGVAEDHSLRDRHSVVEIAQSVQFPVFLFDGNVELLDTLKGELILLDKDTNGVAHETLGNLQDIHGHRGREQHDLGARRQVLEHVVDLVLEPARKHFIGLIQNKHFDVLGPQRTTVDHIEHTAGSTDNNVDTGVEPPHVFAVVGTTDASMAFHLHVVTEGNNDLLDLLCQFAGRREDQCLCLLFAGVDRLQDRDRERGGLARAGLGLGNDITALEHRHDGALLNGRGALETWGPNVRIVISQQSDVESSPVSVDTTQKFLTKLHVVEGVGDFVPVGLQAGVVPSVLRRPRTVLRHSKRPYLDDSIDIGEARGLLRDGVFGSGRERHFRTGRKNRDGRNGGCQRPFQAKPGPVNRGTHFLMSAMIGGTEGRLVGAVFAQKRAASGNNGQGRPPATHCPKTHQIQITSIELNLKDKEATCDRNSNPEDAIGLRVDPRFAQSHHRKPTRSNGATRQCC